jgi:hypothetical protein
MLIKLSIAIIADFIRLLPRAAREYASKADLATVDLQTRSKMNVLDIDDRNPN